jgi:aspartate aminotransferase
MLSSRIRQMQESPIRKLVPLADQAKKNGKTVFHLNIGQPDLKTPDVFMNSINQSNLDVISYTHSEGIIDLRNAMAAFFNRDNLDISSENITITNGGSEAIIFALNTVCDPGDHIIIPEPYYANYNGFAEMTGVKIDGIVSPVDRGYHLPDIIEFEKVLKPNTRAILISNPCNPTGVVYTNDELQLLVDWALKNHLVIISDEVYRNIAFDERENLSLLAFKEIHNNLIVIESVSKRFSACGARIGAVISKIPNLQQNILKAAQSRLCPPYLEQLGSVALYHLPQTFHESVKEEYEQRRNIVFDALSQVKGLKISKPEGALYVFVKTDINAEDFAKYLLQDFHIDNKTVMVAPGSGFYQDKSLGINSLRIAYVLNTNELREAMDIFVKGYHSFKETII